MFCKEKTTTVAIIQAKTQTFRCEMNFLCWWKFLKFWNSGKNRLSLFTKFTESSLKYADNQPLWISFRTYHLISDCINTDLTIWKVGQTIIQSTRTCLGHLSLYNKKGYQISCLLVFYLYFILFFWSKFHSLRVWLNFISSKCLPYLSTLLPFFSYFRSWQFAFWLWK